MSKKGLPEGAYGLKPGQVYVPYVPSDKFMPEFTATSIILSIILTIVFGAANAYLGLKVGMTVSAAIPAAVISMAILRGVMRRKSILENNMVQVIASAGEALAAGAIFTIPALFLWGENPSLIEMSLLTFVGGILGVLFMIPLRRYLIVKEHGKLTYPEGTACAEVLVAGEEGGAGAGIIFIGGAVGLLFKFLGDGLKLFPTEIEWEIPGFTGAAIGADVYPALLGVGFIIGPQVSAYMLAGAVLGWLCLIPAITFFGSGNLVPIFPATVAIAELGYWGVWSNYIKYIGAGAVATAGIISLIKSLPIIVGSFMEAVKGFTVKGNENVPRVDKDINPKWLLVGIAVIIIAIAVLPQFKVGFIGAILIAIFGFFFVTVSSRIVGLVGSSSNPVSGMTIAALLLTTIIMKSAGYSGISGMIAALCVGAIICTAAAIAGDTSQDLKTGYLLGATPWKLQVGQFIGVTVSAITIGFVMLMLNSAYGFGSKELAAPQASLMKMVIEGIMNGNLPWDLVFIGGAASIMIELFGIPSLPVSIGLYLPIHLSTPIMAGGLIRWALEKIEKREEVRKNKEEAGILYASGLIAGEGLMGVIIAALAYFDIKYAVAGAPLGKYGALGLFIIVAISLIYYTFRKKNSNLA